MMSAVPDEAHGQPDRFSVLRERMVRQQIEARGVRDERVLKAMRTIERHRFVPAENRHQAYEDAPLEIGEGQTISQPYIVALMTELLRLEGEEKVLEIGTGSGYQAAVLGELAGQVYSVEIIPSLAERAGKILGELGYQNILIETKDGYQGWPEEAPFDRIIVTAAPPEIPKALIEQLAEGGRMVIPVGTSYQQLEVVVKENGVIKRSVVIPVRFVPMVRQEE